MASSITLPPSTAVYSTGFTNAAYLQRITITPPSGGGSAWSWQGNGEGEHIIGTKSFTTPGGNQNLVYQVDCQYSSDGGSTWNESSLFPGGCIVGSMNMRVMLSEDHVDQDFNDAVAQFVWWEPLS